MARSEAKGPYDILQGAMTQHDLSTSAGPPLLKRCRQVPTATVLCPTAHEAEVPPPVL